MFNFEKINLSFSFNYLLLIAAIILLALYAFFTYRFTVPIVNPSKKILLTSLRTIGLLLIIFIVFEPKLNLTKKSVIRPKNLIFIDNSKSIQIIDGTGRSEE